MGNDQEMAQSGAGAITTVYFNVIVRQIIVRIQVELINKESLVFDGKFRFNTEKVP